MIFFLYNIIILFTICNSKYYLQFVILKLLTEIMEFLPTYKQHAINSEEFDRALAWVYANQKINDGRSVPPRTMSLPHYSTYLGMQYSHILPDFVQKYAHIIHDKMVSGEIPVSI